MTLGYTAVFTSTKSAQYVQILLIGRKQTSRIARDTSNFSVAGIRPLSEWQLTGIHPLGAASSSMDA